MKKFICASVVVAMAGLSVAAWAGPGLGGEGRGEGPGMMGPGGAQAMGARILQRVLDNPEKMKELGITTEQAAALQTSFYEMEKKMVTLQSEAELAQIEVRRLMDEDSPDETALMAAIDKAGLAHTAIQKATVEQRLTVRKIVGPETMKKIKQLVSERMRQARGGGDNDGARMRGPRGDEDHPDGGKGAPWQHEQMDKPGEE